MMFNNQSISSVVEERLAFGAKPKINTPGWPPNDMLVDDPSLTFDIYHTFVPCSRDQPQNLTAAHTIHFEPSPAIELSFYLKIAQKASLLQVLQLILAANPTSDTQCQTSSPTCFLPLKEVNTTASCLCHLLLFKLVPAKTKALANDPTHQQEITSPHQSLLRTAAQARNRIRQVLMICQPHSRA